MFPVSCRFRHADGTARSAAHITLVTTGSPKISEFYSGFYWSEGLQLMGCG